MVADDADLVGDKVDGVVATMLATARMESIKLLVLPDGADPAGDNVARVETACAHLVTSEVVADKAAGVAVCKQ